MTDRTRTPGSDLTEQAAYWFAMLRNEDCPAAKRKAFELWLDESAAHEQAYKQVEHAWAASAFLEHEPELVSLRHRAIRGSVVAKPPRHWLAVAAVATLAVAAALVLSMGTETRNPDAPPPEQLALQLDQISAGQSIETAVGERSTFVLEDGSSVELNTATQLRVLFSENAREIILIKGQALFDVAPNTERPFVVFAADRKITALGTEFEVRLDREDVAVTLLEGKVEVAEISMGSNDSSVEPLRVIELEPGQRISGDMVERQVVDVDALSRALSWRQGRLDFEDERLSDVIYEINRYSIHEVRLSDPSLGELRVSGSFKAGSVEGFASALTNIYPLDSNVRSDSTGAKTIYVYARGGGSAVPIPN